MTSARREWIGGAGAAALILLVLPFSRYAAEFGWGGLARDLSGETYLFASGAPASNAALSFHMLAGALVTLAAPLQLVGGIRRRWPRLHHWVGYTVAGSAAVAGVGGLLFILLRGTIGGPAMDAAFAGYGALILVTAVQTVRHSRAGRYGRHRRWGERLVILALASWAYRAQYVLWYIATDGLWSTPEFTGSFDYFTMVWFYLGWLGLWELWRARHPGEPPVARREGRAAL